MVHRVRGEGGRLLGRGRGRDEEGRQQRQPRRGVVVLVMHGAGGRRSVGLGQDVRRGGVGVNPGLAGLLGLAQPGEDDLGHLGGGGGELGEAARHPPAEAGEAGQGGGEVRGPGLLLQPLLANMTPWSVAWLLVHWVHT